MADFVDDKKTNTGDITWVSSVSHNAQVKIGNTSRNIKFPNGYSDQAMQEQALTDCLDLVNPRTMGTIVSRSRMTMLNEDYDIPADITGRHATETFTLREIRGGVVSYVKISIPFFAGNAALSTADKATVGAQLADLLSGDLASYAFVS